MKASRDTLGPDHMDTLISVNNLGILLQVHASVAFHSRPSPSIAAFRPLPSPRTSFHSAPHPSIPLIWD